MVASGGVPWYEWKRAQDAPKRWFRDLCGTRAWTVQFGEASYADFTNKMVKVDPKLIERLNPDARKVPITWGKTRLTRVGQIRTLASRALTEHEAAHVLFTGTDWRVRGSYHKNLVNVLEDERIERLLWTYSMRAHYDVLELGKRLWFDSFVPTRERNLNLLNACLYLRWDRHQPKDIQKSVSFLDEHDTELFWKMIFPLVERSWAAYATRDVSELALEIMDIWAIPQDYDIPRDKRQIPGSDEPVRGDRDPWDGPIIILPGSSKGMDKEKDAKDKEDEKATDSDAADPLLGEAKIDSDPSSEADYDYKVHGALGELLPLRQLPYLDLVDEVTPWVKQLTKELMVPHPHVEDSWDEYEGKFNLRAYISTKGRRPFVRALLPGVSAEALRIFLMLDTTGSMYMGDRPSERMYHVKRGTMLLHLACESLGVPLAIAACCDERRYLVNGHSTEDRLFPGNPLQYLQDYETPLKAEGPKALIAGLYGHAQAEAMSRGLNEASRRLSAYPDEKRVIIYICDGQPTDENAEHVAQTVRHVRLQKINVIAVFLGSEDPARSKAMHEMFDPYTIIIPRAEHLPKRLGALLRMLRT